ncbi:MAG: hypothetical protein M1816_000971 [Peltula sp. TS41687]|nr:MAG: hypothetical protein M1816_000971 [Peltula sp. TS41687]
MGFFPTQRESSKRPEVMKSEVSVVNYGAEAALSGNAQDEADMARMGKRQETRRNFGLVTMLALTSTMMCTWETTFPFFETSFLNGGPVTMLYGYIFSFLGSLATCASIAEMASMYPTSGGQYHWVAVISPPRYSKFCSWLTGWVSIIGWQAATALGTYLGGTIIQALLVLNHPEYKAKRWHGTLLLYAVLSLTLLVNTVLSRVLPALEGLILILHFVGFFAILIPLVHLAPTSPASYVFGNFTNLSGYGSDGLSWFIGLVPSATLFIGYDGAWHMAEECHHAAVNVPRSMIFTMFLNGAAGFAMYIVILFSIGNAEEVFKKPTGWAFVEIFNSGTMSKAGATAMTSILIALYICAAFGFMAAASRQTWAFARDNGLPLSRYLCRTHPTYKIPLYAIGFTTVINSLLALINIGSNVAFTAVLSLVVAGYFSSYLISIFLVILRRLRKLPLEPGPWNLGRFGLPVNIFAFFYTLLVLILSFFPPSTPVTAQTMNWSVVVYSAVLIFGIIFYFTYGHKHYQGPLVNRPLTQ